VFLGRIVADGEPLWLPEDAQAVLDYFREESLTCPGCGLPRDETMTPEAEDHYRSRAMRCHACAARERATSKFDDRPHESAGLYFTVEKRPPEDE
jgi:hypothetical protein